MTFLNDIPVELSAIVGDARLPLGDLVKLGRGAVVALGVPPESAVALEAAGRPVALGDVTVEGDRVSVTLTHLLRDPG